jgi:hypothetical protein
MFCNFRGKCKHKPNEKHCIDPTRDKAIEMVEDIIAFAKLADTLHGAVILRFVAVKSCPASCCMS